MTFFEKLASKAKSKLPLKISSLLLLYILLKPICIKLLVKELKEEEKQ
jgi:hypothetical protein